MLKLQWLSYGTYEVGQQQPTTYTTAAVTLGLPREILIDFALNYRQQQQFDNKTFTTR